MRKLSTAALVCAACVAASSTALAGYDFNETCAYYDTRAEGKPRGMDAAWIVHIAESCNSALVQIAGAEVADTDPNQQYLTRLEKFRRFVTLLAVNRIREHKEREIETGIKEPLTNIWLTETGEYLIARKLEVTRAYDIWMDETGLVVAGID